MLRFSRRLFMHGAVSGAGGMVATGALALGPGTDGRAAGYAVSPSADFLPLIPRRTGDPVTFTASLDRAALKATSGGWAREITTRQLPIATGIAGAHLFLNPGGIREMHWHNSAEWAYVLAGRCQVAVADPAGELEVANYGPGDLWYFPTGHAHSIQALGGEPCHAILAFNDGLYSERGTFGLSDLISRLEPATLARSLGVPAGALDGIPGGEVYIRQGEVITEDGPEAAAAWPLDAARTHRHRLAASRPWFEGPGGAIRVASAREFPLSADMTGVVTRLRPGALHAPHWHPNANEWLYAARGRVRVTMFAADKRMATSELAEGDCAYVPANCAHLIENAGPQDCEVVAALDSGTYREGSVSEWMARAPRHALAGNLGLPEAALARFGDERVVIAAA